MDSVKRDEGEIGDALSAAIGLHILAGVADVGDAAAAANDFVRAMCAALEAREFGNTHAHAAITGALGALQLARGQLQLAALFAAREQSGFR